jgi:hypothetical protein
MKIKDMMFVRIFEINPYIRPLGHLLPEMFYIYTCIGRKIVQTSNQIGGVRIVNQK